MILELFRYRDLIVSLVARDLKLRYRRSMLGFAWTMLQPLMMMLVLHLVFSKLMRFEGVRNYSVYALSGIMFYNFFSQSILASMNSLRSNAYVLQKVPVPLAIFPITAVFSGVINFCLALVPLLGIVIATGHQVGWSLLFLPISILIAATFTLGAGLLLSPLAVFFNDVVEMVGVSLTLFYFLTPVFWPLSLAEGNEHFWIVRYNPIRSILEVFRDPIYYGKIPPLSHLSVSVLIAVVLLAIGLLAFRKSADRIPFYV